MLNQHHLNSSLFSLLLAAATLSSNCSSNALSPDFKLKVQVIDSNQGEPGSSSLLPGLSSEGATQDTAPSGQFRAEVASADQAATGKAPLKARAETEDTVSKGEFGVDWSAWISDLADRWYKNLKNMEYRCGKVINTKRTALIKFTCYRDGSIGGVSLKQSSGVPFYDQMQIEALKRVTPLPPFPSGTRRYFYTLLQGWEGHPATAGAKDFQLGSYGKNFPVEHIHQKLATRKLLPGAQISSKSSKTAQSSPAQKDIKPVKKTALASKAGITAKSSATNKAVNTPSPATKMVNVEKAVASKSPVAVDKAVLKEKVVKETITPATPVAGSTKSEATEQPVSQAKNPAVTK